MRKREREQEERVEVQEVAVVGPSTLERGSTYSPLYSLNPQDRW